MCATVKSNAVTNPSFPHLMRLFRRLRSLQLPPVPELGPIMAKPILLSVDDDSDVLRAIERDLRSKYGAEYRVMASDSPEGALTLLNQLKVRNDNVALLLAYHPLPPNAR